MSSLHGLASDSQLLSELNNLQMKPDEEFYAYCAHLEALASLRPALFTEPLLTSTLEREL